MTKPSYSHLKPWVLVAEDDPELTQFLSDALDRSGFRVQATSSIADLMRKIENQAYASLVLDWRLGDQTTEEVIQMLRENSKHENHGTPIMVISGHLDAEMVKRIRTSIQDILVKPFDHKALVSKVKQLCDPYLGSRAPAR